MKKILSRSEPSGDCSGPVEVIPGCYGFCTGLYGDCTGLSGDCTRLHGDCTNVKGNCSGLSGNLAEITPQERVLSIKIEELVNEVPSEL